MYFYTAMSGNFRGGGNILHSPPLHHHHYHQHYHVTNIICCSKLIVKDYQLISRTILQKKYYEGPPIGGAIAHCILFVRLSV